MRWEGGETEKLGEGEGTALEEKGRNFLEERGRENQLTAEGGEGGSCFRLLLLHSRIGCTLFG